MIMKDIIPDMCNKKYFNVLFCADHDTPRCEKTCDYADNPRSKRETYENLNEKKYETKNKR